MSDALLSKICTRICRRIADESVAIGKLVATEAAPDNDVDAATEKRILSSIDASYFGGE